MSTSALITVKKDGEYYSIYCHSDGYPEYLYRILIQNFNSQENANWLIKYGDASFIYNTEGLVRWDDDAGRGYEDVEIGTVKDVGYQRGSKFYCNMKGEHTPSVTPVKTLKEATPDKDSWVEYHYVWNGERWYCNTSYNRDVLCEDEEVLQDLYKELKKVDGTFRVHGDTQKENVTINCPECGDELGFVIATVDVPVFFSVSKEGELEYYLKCTDTDNIKEHVKEVSDRIFCRNCSGGFEIGDLEISR